MVCVIFPEMSLLVYMYMTTGGQERGIEGGMEGEGGRGGECSACGRDWRTCPTDNVLRTDHIHVPCTLLFAHVAHSSREDIHVHVQSEGEEAGGVVADHSKGQDTRQSTIAIQAEVDEDAITVSWQVPRHNEVGGAHILH